MKTHLIAAGLIFSSLVGLSGCASTTAPEAKKSANPSVSATPTPTKDPILLAAGSAKDNLYFFTWVIQRALATDSSADSFAVAQAVGSAGFDPATVQFTFSRTAAGLEADTSAVAVQFSGECMVAQFGPAAPKVVSRVLPVLATGGCLLGTEVQSLG